MDIRAEIQTRVDEIEQIIKRYLPEEEGWQKTIMEAMNYSILAGGKRLRPMLMSETIVCLVEIKSDRAFYGGDGDDSYLFSGAR